MEEQATSKIPEIVSFRNAISTTLNLIKASDTIGGALVLLKSLYSLIQTHPSTSQILASAEAKIFEEDRIAFENREKAVAWLHEKIKTLLPYAKWEKDSYSMEHIHAVLNFRSLSLSSTGYVGALVHELRKIFLEVSKDKVNFPLFEGWTQFQDSTGFIFTLPECVDKELSDLSIDEKNYQWREKADTSLTCLLRLIKILILYDSFSPLILGGNASQNAIPRNLREFEEIEYRAHVGIYLSLFRSPDPSKHPLSNSELGKLVDRFLDFLEQQIELCFQNDQTIDRTSKKSKPEHGRTAQCNQDVATLIPYAKKIWVTWLQKTKNPRRLHRNTLAKTLLLSLPPHISLHSKGENRLPRARKAIHDTDPRIFDNRGHMEVELKPHWEKFGWINSSH